MTEGPAVLDGVSVVVRGLFTPPLFSPAWLLAEQLIGPHEFENAEVEVIAREIAVFNTGWLNVHVTSDTLQVSTTEVEEFERLRDAASGILRALVNTPVAALGINRDRHFTVESVERWHAIGDILTPKELWESELKLPGMRSVTMWGLRPDPFVGRVQVQVEPSLRIPQAVFVTHNDHYVLGRASHQPTERVAWEMDEPLEPSVERLAIALEILTEHWSDSLRRAQGVFTMLAGIGGGS